MTVNGIGLLYEKTLKPFMESQVIDFIDNTYGKGLVIAPEGGNLC
jgi:hypothetical protein